MVEEGLDRNLFGDFGWSIEAGFDLRELFSFGIDGYEVTAIQPLAVRVHISKGRAARGYQRPSVTGEGGELANVAIRIERFDHNRTIELGPVKLLDLARERLTIKREFQTAWHTSLLGGSVPTERAESQRSRQPTMSSAAFNAVAKAFTPSSSGRQATPRSSIYACAGGLPWLL